MLVGNLVSIFSGGFIVLIVSLLTRSPLTAEQVEEEWAKTHNIDNPLSPWIQTYKVYNTKNNNNNIADSFFCLN